MSYTQADCAMDICYLIASTDIEQMDPDELYTWATQVITDARYARDGYDDNGYEKVTDNG